MSFTPDSAAISIVWQPITGTSKRKSWSGFDTLTTTAIPFPSAAPRRIASFVPSNASTAKIVPWRITTVWPISNRLTSLATVNPYSASSKSRRFAFGPASQPDPARESSRKVVAGKRVTPALANSTATPPNSVSAFLFFNLLKSISAFRSGRSSNKFFGVI